MLRSVRLRKGLVFLLGLVLLSFFSAGSATAAPNDEVFKELQQRVDGLESLVKDLSIAVMNASKNLEAQATGLQPRIFNVENMVKDLSFDVKKTVAAMADMQGNVDALIAQVEEFQPLVITLQSTVVKFGDKIEYITGDIDKLTVGLANVSEQADQLDARVTVMSDHLGGQIATLSDEFAELYSATSALKATVETNSGQIGELFDAAVNLNVRVEENTEDIYENNEAIEELFGFQAEASEAFEALESLLELPVVVGELSVAAGTLDERTSKLERAVDELSILGPTLASLRNTVAGLAARSDRVDARLGRLEDFAEQFAGASEAFGEVGSMAQGLASRLSMMEKAIEELKAGAGLSEDLQAQIDQLKSSIGGAPADVQAQLDDLKSAVSKIGQILIELESTKMEVSALREQVGSETTIDRQQIVSEIRTEITKEITDLSDAARKAEDALKQANAANGLALLALLAGVAAIALNLLL